MQWNGVRSEVPRVVEGANFVGVERDGVAFFVAVIWGIRSDGGEEGEEEEEEEREVPHWEEVWILKGKASDEEERKRGRRRGCGMSVNKRKRERNKEKGWVT